MQTRASTAYPFTSWLDAERVAREHFAVRTFRPGQRALIEAVLSGRDALGVLPTGGGKSLVYQLASLFLDKPVVVVSPLLALMRDQAGKLGGFDVPGARLDSTLRAAEARDALQRVTLGHLDLLFVTPEALRRAEVRAAIASAGVSLFVVDEAHCISSWGHDFRPAYLGLRRAFEELGRPPVLAVTATATTAVADDICAVLGLREPVCVRTSGARSNLALRVARTPSEDTKHAQLLLLLARHKVGSGIIYTSTVKRAEALWASLTRLVPSVGRYHGELPADVRATTQEAFMDGRYKLIVATKAFGMGIDKSDVRFVIHDSFPDSLESYVQEAGRAGRDGLPATATLLYRLEDRRVQEYFLRDKYPSQKQIERVLSIVSKGVAGARHVAKAARVAQRKVEALLPDLGLGLDGLAAASQARHHADRERLRTMMGYAEHQTCRWHQILTHFDEASEARCDRCDVCAR